MENSTFRGMRWKLATLFDKIFIVNLHGNSKEVEKNDENVFDIQQGVAITILVRSEKHNDSIADLRYIDVSGSREEKYSWLDSNGITVINNCVVSESPNYFFILIMITSDLKLDVIDIGR